MGPGRFTTLAQAALSSAQRTAITRSHAEVTPVHILAALLGDGAGLTATILARAKTDAARVAQVVASVLDRLPTVTAAEGAVVQPQTGPATVKVLAQAQTEAAALKDSFVSTEHLLLALAAVSSDAAEVLTTLGLDRSRLLDAIKEIRAASGVEHVDEADAESHFEALRKYGVDLVELAQAGKLDPVIGRDEEIKWEIVFLPRL